MRKIFEFADWMLSILMTVCLIAIPIITFAGLWLNYGLVWALIISFSILLIMVAVMRFIGSLARESSGVN